MNDLVRMVTRSVIGAAVWKGMRRLGPVATVVVLVAVCGKGMRRLGPVATVVVLVAVCGIYLVVGR